MPFTPTPIKDLVIFEPRVFEDDRGFFLESYNKQLFKDNGIDTQFIQDNHSKSSYGVLRGLHFQLEPYAQAKLVRVVQGEVLDVAVDLRAKSQTYGQWFSIKLSAENKKQLFVPRGFAHGFVVLSDTAEFLYKVDNVYSKESEGGIAYNDPTLNIDWQIDLSKVLVSDKDKVLKSFNDLE
ncbi:MAG: dTDP-4-dehydrorhamnose 3,5-epimerase [bacterium]